MTGPDAGRPRRSRTRWLVIGPLAALAVMIAGVFALEAVHPQRDTSGMRVDGVPPLFSDEVITCTRRQGDETADDLRAQFTDGGRVSATQVYACPQAFDQRIVVYAGEVVGELINRDGGVWAQVNDDAYALEVGPVVGHREHAGFNTGLSVWLADGLHESISDVGRPARRGDVVLVSGTLMRADPDDGGGVTLRAERLEVLAPSVAVDVPIHTLQVVVAIALATAAAGALAWSRSRNRR